MEYFASKITGLHQRGMNEYIGKNIGNKDHHSVPITLWKAKTFLEDEYLHEILAASDQKCFYFKAKCYHSFRKNDPPHQLKLALCIIKGDVLDSGCSCIAGKVGFCNHISALMLKVCKVHFIWVKNNKRSTGRGRWKSCFGVHFAASEME